MSPRHPAIANLVGLIMILAFAVLTAKITGHAPSQSRNTAVAIDLPRFDRVLLLDDTSQKSAGVSIGDLDGDGNLDLVFANGGHSALIDRVQFGDGHGRFPVGRNLGEAEDRSYSASLVDIDGDGDLDVVIGNEDPDPKPVYLNDGTGHFHVGSTYGRPAWPTRNANVADLNSDGLPDIIVANRTDTSNSNYVCLNRGGGKFDDSCLAFSHESATTITPADLNGDGFIDLAVPHREGGQSYVYLNDGKAGFPKRVPFGPTDAAMRMVQAADVNSDGRIDIVTIDEKKRGLLIYFNQGGGAFSAGLHVGDSKSIPYALVVGDLNRDGKVDVVVGNVEAPSTIYFNDGSGRVFTPVQLGDGKGVAMGFAIGDLDKDGVPDIAFARQNAPNVIYFGKR